MDRRDSDALDRHITGNYGEDQLRDWWDAGDDDYIPTCQVANCGEDAEDGVLCAAHQPSENDDPINYDHDEENDDAPLR